MIKRISNFIFYFIALLSITLIVLAWIATLAFIGKVVYDTIIYFY